jgi:heptosyltransferase-1
MARACGSVAARLNSLTMNAHPVSEKPSVLVVKLSSLGDLFHALPTVHAIKTHLGASVEWVVQQEYLQLVKCFTDVDFIITTQRRSFIRNMSELKKDLHAHQYDLVIDLQGLMKSAIVVAMAKSPRKIGPAFHRECSQLFYHEIAGAKDMTRHAVEQNLDLARHLGCETPEVRFPVEFPEFALEANRRHVGLLPCTRWPSKTWPEEHYIKLAKSLLDDENTFVHVLGSLDDLAVCHRIHRVIDHPRVINQSAELTLPMLGGLLARLDLLISGDSGPVHIAAAVGTPTLVLFGPTEAGRTGPYGEGHRIIRAPAPCEPCFNRSCHRHGEPCMAGITPGEVADAARAMLESGTGKPG